MRNVQNNFLERARWYVPWLLPCNKAMFSRKNVYVRRMPGPEVMKPFSCSTQLSTKFQLLIKLIYRQIKKCHALSLSEVVFIMLINVKMPTFVGILTFMRRINFVLS